MSQLKTVLINRKANEIPKDWELQLRPLTNKLRVVEKLSGVHLLVSGNPSVAVRIYDVDDANRLENEVVKEDNDKRLDVDGLCTTFRDKFENSLCIFLLPSGEHQRDQLGRRDSFVSQAQQSLLHRDKTTTEKKHVTRTAIVTDAAQVVQTIQSTVASLQPDKREKKAKYFQQVATKHFLPGGVGKPTQEVIANHVMKTFNAWADRYEMEEGDSSVVLNTLESLVNVGTANANTLEDVPIRDASKELLATFFGSNGTSSSREDIEAQEVLEELMEPCEEDEFDDYIDDSEFLDIPDPSTQHKPSQQAGAGGLPTETPFQPRTLFQPNTAIQQQKPMGMQMVNTVEFTPMVPPTRQQQQYQYPQQQRQQLHGGYNNTSAAPSIFPETYSTQGSFSQHPNAANFQHQSSFNHYSSDQGEYAGEYYSQNRYDGNNDDYGGEYNSYSQQDMFQHPHTKFM